MVGLGRLELPTSPLSGVRSNQLSYRPILTCLFCAWTSLHCFTRLITYRCMFTHLLIARLAKLKKYGVKTLSIKTIDRACDPNRVSLLLPVQIK